MKFDEPLTPNLVQFVREQLASGRFETEGDVIRAALRLLEEEVQSHRSFPRKPSHTTLTTTGPSEPGPTERFGKLRERLLNDASTHSSSRRSPRGMLADLPSRISPEDIKEARTELWASFPHGGA